MVSLVRGVPDEGRERNMERVFKDAMRRLAGGVVVITAGKGSDISGMTVTSFSSLSLDPPSVVVGVNRQSSSWPLIQRYRSFGANVLSGGQVEIAQRFTGQGGLTGADRFRGAAWSAGETGAPLLADALAAFDCRVERTVDCNSHVLLIASVASVRTGPDDVSGLAYWSGRYNSVGSSPIVPESSQGPVPTARALQEF